MDVGIPDRIRKLLTEKLEIDDEDVYTSAAPLGRRVFMTIAIGVSGAAAGRERLIASSSAPQRRSTSSGVEDGVVAESHEQS